MSEPTNQTETIPPVRVAEFPQGQLALQSPEGWIYQRIDGKDVYPNANQQPVSNYYDVHLSGHPSGPEADARRYILWPDGQFIDVGDVPVWDWEGTSLAKKHFRPVPTSAPSVEATDGLPTEPERRDEFNQELDSLKLVPELTGRIYAIERHLDRIATALEGILADLTKGNDADKA